MNELNQYRESVPEDFKARFIEIEEAVKEAFPDAELRFSYKIFLFRRDKKRKLGLGYRKDGVTLLTEIPPFFEEFKARYPELEYGKGSIRITKKKDLTKEMLDEFIQGILG